MKSFIKKTILLITLFLFSYTYSDENNKVLVFSEKGREFQEVIQGLKDELDTGYEIKNYIPKKGFSYSKFVKKIKYENPKVIVVLDNKYINFATLYNKNNSNHKKIPFVATMGLNIRNVIKRTKNICAIDFEVPGFSIITGFRKYSNKNIKNVLVFYRASKFQDKIDRTKLQLKRENINLISINVEKNGKRQRNILSFLRKNLSKNARKRNIDAIWVMPDNGIVNQSTIGLWINSAKSIPKPFLSNIKQYAESDINFCTYVASPIFEELGGQTANLILDVIEDKSIINNIQTEDILSYCSVVNKSLAKKLNISIK